jgi:uncharacterized protein (TIGR02246 family)
MWRSLSFLGLVVLAACTTQQARRSDTASPAAATLAGTTATDVATARKAIDSANARAMTAAVAGDTATFAGLYADDAVLMMPNAQAAVGHAAIAKALAGLMVNEKLTNFKLTTRDVIAAGDYAIETGAVNITLQPKSGKAMSDVGKYLTVWKKQPDGSYRIVRDMVNSDLPGK